MSQGQLYPIGDAGRYQDMRTVGVDFIFCYKNNDN